MNYWALPFIAVGAVFIIKPEWGGKYLIYHGRTNLLTRNAYNNLEETEKNRKYLMIASKIVGLAVVGMGIFALLYS